jgi:NAD(P)-dependent dehydrogenase (short-subunit alcohol dehydrogenase family)
VDILVNNVGIYATKDFVDVTDDEWDNYYQVNVRSGIRLSRALLPTMLQRNRGRILFISSEAGLRTLPHLIPYSVSKVAQIAVARGLAQLTNGSLVTVNSLLPGPTWTEGVKAFLEGYAEDNGLEHHAARQSFYLGKHEPDSLSQRFLEPTEVAAVAAFSCSDLASSINGTAQRAEGGSHSSLVEDDQFLPYITTALHTRESVNKCSVWDTPKIVVVVDSLPRPMLRLPHDRICVAWHQKFQV